ncbi:OmpA family protein [Colwellia psychrerythraea]|uniref:OmpA/MotB domain protein n=1 Tax=Colwellia psychrerythraea TaxID=28229 RepID=A0A099L705_COLPS|nr:OmpA family protein [Colwellia psychrerythraea]KGJ97653.1 OmpA/MotB domain protein [Colwellia psychrerythraea]
MHSFQKYRLSSPVSILIPIVLFFSFITHAVEDQEAKPNIENTDQQTQAALPSSYFYLGGKLGINHYQHGCESWSLDCDKNSFAAGVFTGFQFNENFALEAAYIDLGDAKASYLENGNAYQHTGSMKGLELSALGSMYLTEKVTAFAKAGVFNWHGENKGPFNKTTADDWSTTVGAGITYQLNDAWQARFEYQYFNNLGNDTIGGTNAHLTSIGISYQFGRTRPSIVTKTVVKFSPVELEEVTFPLLFDFDKSNLLLTDSLNVIINRLTKYRQAQVILRGYSDTKGNSDYNLALSKRRVDSIANYLIAAGVNETQIISEYFGEQYPVSDNTTEEHRHLNRNVKILLPKTFVNAPQEQ